MSRGDELVHLDDVTKIFYTDEIETHALSGIHLTIDEGEYVSIAGPSGGGKSTLLSILGLLDTPSTGEYRLKGAAVRETAVRERARMRNREVGFIFQSFNLIGDLNVFENVKLRLSYPELSNPDGRRKGKADLGPVGRGPRWKNYPSNLSG